uniref:Replication factor A C-terminal domain-containing protein n=1 Tax=Plectus sambesii TaxID=2011161 RepID=A0A914XKM1_9BILA
MSADTSCVNSPRFHPRQSEEIGENIEQQVVAISRDNSAPRDGMWDMRMIGIADTLQLGNRDEEKGAYFNVKAMIANIKTENALYKACIEEGCKKKVVEGDNYGMSYRCEKCNKTSPKYKYITLLSAEVTDLSGTHWVTIFEESAQKLLGKSAAELGAMMENDKDSYYAAFETVRFKSFIFRIRSKMETYNDEQKIKWTVYDVRPVPWDQYIDALNKAIETATTL